MSKTATIIPFPWERIMPPEEMTVRILRMINQKVRLRNAQQDLIQLTPSLNRTLMRMSATQQL